MQFVEYIAIIFQILYANLNQNISLEVEEQRFLLRLRYFQLITNGAIANVQNAFNFIDSSPIDINEFLYYLVTTSSLPGYSSTRIYVRDNLDMTMTYVLTGLLPGDLLLAIETLDIFPRPAGVERLIEYDLAGDFLLLDHNIFGLLDGQNLSLL